MEGRKTLSLFFRPHTFQCFWQFSDNEEKWNQTIIEPFTAGINGGYYSGGLHTQQAHSTTPLEAPHSAGSTHASSGPPQQSAVSAPPAASAVAPPPGIQHAMVSKSVCLLFPFLSVGWDFYFKSNSRLILHNVN